MNPSLPNPFLPVDKAAWRAQVQKDLHDTAAPDSLRRTTPDGLLPDPYYTAEELAALPVGSIQAAQKALPGWLNAPERTISDPRSDNTQLRSARSRGAGAFVLMLPPDQTGAASLSQLLDGLKLSDTPVFFRTTAPLPDLVRNLTTVAPYQLKGGLLTDPVAGRLQTGTAPTERLRQVAAVTRTMAASDQFRTVCANGTVFHNAGATATQELAFLLGSLAEQYDALTDAGLPPDLLIPKTMVSVSVGTDYFTEIAKLRALRVLWQRFLSAYQPTHLPAGPYVHVQTSAFYRATGAPYTNLIRATTEAMAAVIGGCDALTVLPFSTTADAGFSDRVARNLSLLLAEESYLDKVADPSAGSYYLETLTHQVAETAWTYFLRVEAMGGLLRAVDAGFVRAELDAAYRAKVDALHNGRVMVGVNKFREGDALPKPAPVQNVIPDTLPDRPIADEFD